MIQYLSKSTIFCDAMRSVFVIVANHFFIDAQGKDVNTWVSSNPPLGYQPEIFFQKVLL